MIPAAREHRAVRKEARRMDSTQAATANAAQHDRWLKGWCAMCLSNECGILVHVKDGVVTEIKGNPECPTNRGTLFMDEIGDLPLDFQGKLLRALQEGEIIKLGTSASRKVDVRFIAATNADLDKLLAKGQFRKDLYYRLKGAWLFIVPLRERREDIPLLINVFLREFRGDLTGQDVEEDALDILLGYDYPGNIRELRSIIQSSCNLSQKKPIGARYLPEYIRKSRPKAAVQAGRTGPIVPLAEAERVHILQAYEETTRNKLRTAKLLGIGLNTLRRKLASYGVD